MTAEKPIRVLVVDDSAFARKVLRETLTLSHAVEVVGVARDGLEALEKIAELKPDVVTLDLIMPNLDGLGVLRALPPVGAPRVVIVSISDGNSALGIEALHMGAVELVQKPTALATDRLYELSAELVAKVVAAGRSHPRPVSEIPMAAPGGGGRTGGATSARAGLAAASGRAVELIVIGTSTGGPQALTRLIVALPAGLPCPVAVALHIPAGYTETLAKRLDDASALRVFEASEGAPLLPGTVAIARGGMNLRIRGTPGALTGHLDRTPTGSPFSPSVDVLFESAAATVGAAVLGVVLTGMGNDGTEGARALVGRGARVLTEAESSCVVYGMPRAVVEAGLSAGAAPLEQMVDKILENL